jgi:hypothetical protein
VTRDVWVRSPIVVKALVILTILRCFAAPGYGTYYLFFGG